jgi:ectoine hydroxylase-related dioxygenase (phytanoyl-CoA dioxygenase family)
MLDVDAYRRDGYAVIRGVLTAGEVGEYRAEAQRLLETCNADPSSYEERIQWEVDYLAPADAAGMEQVIRKLEPISDISEPMMKLAFRPGVVDAADSIFGEPVELFEDKLNLKLPGGSPYPWHQDWSCCWRAHTDELITCFVYLDDADETNGCLQVVPGSHLGKPTHPFRDGGHFEVTPEAVPQDKITRFRSGPAT